MLAHLAVPVGQPLQRHLPPPLGAARGRRLARVPEVARDQRQQHPRRLGDGVGLDLHEAVQRVVLPVAEQLARPDDAVAVAPVEAQVVGEGRVGDAVVGVDHDPARRVDHPGVVVEGPHPLPVVDREPARRRDAPLAGVPRQPRRRRAGHLQRHRVVVGHGDVQRRRQMLARRLARRPGSNAPASARSTALTERSSAVSAVQARRRHVPRRGHRRRAEVVARDDRPVPGPAQPHPHRLRPAHPDHRLAGLEAARSPRASGTPPGSSGFSFSI